MIKTLSFSVTGQQIKITEPAMLVAGTVNIYNASFSFDADWDGFQRTAVFSVDGVSREQLLTDDACTLPWEVLSAGKYLRVGVYGSKGEKRLPTIWTEHALYISSGAGPTEEAAEPSPTLVEQLLSKIGSLDSLKTEDKASLVAAINEIWASGGGGSGGTTDHSKLTNRDADDQHPMSAITGLVKALAGKQPSGDYLTQETDPTVPSWAKAEEKPSYTASEVGADPSGTAASQVAAHNTGADTHSDIRLLISGLTDRINALADSDDTTLDQLSEIVAYIKSNRTLIEAITTSKVSVSDIIDNLTTNASNKPLSAAQGVALKVLIDAITIPEKLPNPNALTFTGAVKGSYDGSAPLTVNIPSGGSDKELTLLADINFEGNTASRFEYTGLDNVSEIYIVGGEIKSAMDNTASAFSLSINEISVAASSVLNIQKTSGTDALNNYNIMRFNGAFWESLKSPDHAGATATQHANSPKYPNSVVLDVGKAQKIKLWVANPAYKPVTGWMKIWVR